jgi:hypothetical protein
VMRNCQKLIFFFWLDNDRDEERSLFLYEKKLVLLLCISFYWMISFVKAEQWTLTYLRFKIEMVSQKK